MIEKGFDKVCTKCLESINDIVKLKQYKTSIEPIKCVELKEKVLTNQVTSQLFY